MSFLKNTINVFKTVKKNRDDFSKKMDDWSKEIDEKSKQRYYQSMQNIVNDLREKSVIVTSKDFCSVRNGQMSKIEADNKAIARNQLLQKEISKLGDNPTYEELENIMKLYRKISEE